MSRLELERVAGMGRVASGDLGLGSAAEMLELSYRQTKRLWRRYREAGSAGLKHGNAGRPSNRGKPGKLRGRVLQLITKKYSGGEGEPFGPTLWLSNLRGRGLLNNRPTTRKSLGRFVFAAELFNRDVSEGFSDFVGSLARSRWPSSGA